MKTFIVYDLDSQMPVAVGEQVSAETARYCASVATGTNERQAMNYNINVIRFVWRQLRKPSRVTLNAIICKIHTRCL